MIKQKTLKKRKLFKQYYYNIKYDKQILYTIFLKFLFKNKYIEKQVLFTSVYYLSFLLRISSVSNLSKQCHISYTFRSVNKYFRLNRLVLYETFSLGMIPGFQSAN
jgi:ribosomal protein S14